MESGTHYFHFDNGTGPYRMLTCPYSWRRLRRAAHEALTKTALQSYHSIQIKEATILVSSLLSSSASLHLDKHFQRFAGSTTISILYDYPTIVSDHDQTIEWIEEYNLRVGGAAVPGSNLIDSFPWMLYIPERSGIIC